MPYARPEDLLLESTDKTHKPRRNKVKALKWFLLAMFLGANAAVHADNRNERWMGTAGGGAGAAAGGIVGQTFWGTPGAIGGAGVGAVAGQAAGGSVGRAVDGHARSLRDSYPGVHSDPRYDPRSLFGR